MPETVTAAYVRTFFWEDGHGRTEAAKLQAEWTKNAIRPTAVFPLLSSPPVDPFPSRGRPVFLFHHFFLHGVCVCTCRSGVNLHVVHGIEEGKPPTSSSERRTLQWVFAEGKERVNGLVACLSKHLKAGSFRDKYQRKVDLDT